MIFFTMLIVLFVIIVIAYPFFSNNPKPERVLEDIEDDKTILVKQKEYSYTAIKELEFDYNMGKISEDDFQNLRKRYKAEAINAILKLESEQNTKRSPSSYCTECGQKFKKDLRFCTNCGKPNKL